MIKDLVERAKFLQKNRQAELSSFKPEIEKFQHNLVEGIKSFIYLAQEKGVDGTSLKEIKTLGNGIKEFTFQVDGRDLVLIMREELFEISESNEVLGNKSFLYFDGDPSFTPIIEIVIYKDKTESKFYSVSWFSTNGICPLSRRRPLDEDSGENAADDLIRYFYNQSKSWKSDPTRDQFSSQKNRKGNLGFIN